MLENRDSWTDCRTVIMLSSTGEPVGVGFVLFLCEGCKRHKVVVCSQSV